MITIKLDWFVYDHKSLCKNSRDIFLPLDMWQVWPYYDIVKQVIYFISVFVCDMSSSRIWITILKGATACNFICFIITEHSYQKSTVFTMYSSTELCCIVPTSQCVTMPPPIHVCWCEFALGRYVPCEITIAISVGLRMFQLVNKIGEPQGMV